MRKPVIFFPFGTLPKITSPIHPWHPVAMVPESQAMALWEGARKILECYERAEKSLPYTAEIDCFPEFEQSIALLRKGIGE